MTGKSTLTVSVVTFALAAMIIIGQLSGCGSSNSASSSSGTLKMSLTDKQSDDFQNLVISIKEVRVVPAGLEGSSDGDPALPVVASYATPLQVDVLTLKFLLQSLGQVQVPIGSYKQIRLILADNVAGADPVNYLVLKTDPSTKIPLKTPSGNTSGLKLNCLFEISTDNSIELVVDFDPNTAIVATGSGKYIFKPQGIRVVEVKNLPSVPPVPPAPPTSSTPPEPPAPPAPPEPPAPPVPVFGSITGILSAVQQWYTADVRVVPSTGGLPVATTTVVPTTEYSPFQGEFSAFVPAGTYRVHVYAQGFTHYSSPKTSVTNGAETSMGIVSFVRPLIRR